MAHVYDTGLDISQRSTIRQALVTRLEGLSIANGLYAACVKGIPAILHSARDDGDIVAEHTGGQHPAILVALGTKKYDALGSAGRRRDQYMCPLEVHVYVVDSNDSGGMARLEGDVASATVTKAPGMDTMLEHIEELLLGFAIDADGSTHQLEPVEEAELGPVLADFTVWEQRYSIKVERVLQRDKSVEQYLTSLRSRIVVEHDTREDPKTVTDLSESP